MLATPSPAGADPQFQVIATVDVGVNPFGDAVSPDGSSVWVANAGTPGGTQGHTVTVLDASTFATQSVIGVGSFPEDIAFAAVLSNANPGNVVVSAAIAVVGATGRPALTPDGSLLVVPRGRGDLAPPETLLINPATNQIVADLTLGRAGATQAATVTPNGRFASVSILGGSGGVWVIDLATQTTVTVIPTPDTRIFGVEATPDGRFVLATDFLLG